MNKVYSLPMLEFAIEKFLRKGKDKLSQLYIIMKHDEEAEFEKELPDESIRRIRENLKTYEWNRFLESQVGNLSENVVSNFAKFDSELSKAVDTTKIKVFFMRSIPKGAIATTRVFPYPKVSKISIRPFETLSNLPSHLN